ncbi:hypothetical protein Tco_1121136 [Tanacetum coccineum]|uniref:Uncharacterized protein n=1 Tax=Tanacetum coccineum TaxID=301880 RepID=A0ABQ5IWU5_9ASTR
MYLKKAQYEKPCLYEIPHDQSDPANKLIPDREEILTLEEESGLKLNKDLMKPYDYIMENNYFKLIYSLLTKIHKGTWEGGPIYHCCAILSIINILGTVRFGNDQFAPIVGYGDLVQGNITINRVYYVEEPSTPTNVHAEENNDDQAEFTNPFCTSVQEVAESSSHNIDNSNMHTFNQPQDSKFRWTKDHPLTQVRGNPSKLVQTRRQLATDPEISMQEYTSSSLTDSKSGNSLKNPMSKRHFFMVPPKKVVSCCTTRRVSFDPDHPEMFYRLWKSLYGLKQALKTEYQLADMFTKALPEDRFQYLVRRIGMRCLTPAELEDSYKDGDGDASFQLESDSLPHAHAQTTKTYYKHQDSRIMKVQELKTNTSAQTLIYKIFIKYKAIRKIVSKL